MNLRFWKYFLILPLILLPLSLKAQAQDPFQWFFDGETRSVKSQEVIPIQIDFSIPPGYILYKDKFDLKIVQGEGYELGPLQLPPAERKQDPFTGADEEVYHDAVTLKAVLNPLSGFHPQKEDATIKLQIAYQGCSEKLCFKPTKKEILLPISYIDAEGSRFSFKGKSLLWLIVMTFLGGLLSDFTPCVLPIIPITLAFIGIKKSDTRHWHNFVHTLMMVLSMALSYALMGLVVAMLGKSLGFLFQSYYFLIFAVVLYVFFALSMFGLYEIQLPLALRNRLARMGGQNTLGSMLSGVTVGLLAAPCVGPLIGSLLVYVAQEKDLAKGFILLFSYGMGMGSLFLVIGTYFHRLAPKIHGGPFMVWIKRTFGVLLLIPAIYYGSIVYGNMKGSHSSTNPKKNENVWMTDDKAAFKKASQENKPLFVDFYADWCLPCLEMEKNAFSKPEVQTYLTQNFIPLKINCTEETPQCNQMVDRYKVIGWPTMIILDSKGNLLKKYVGESWNAKEFLKNVQKDMSTTGK